MSQKRKGPGNQPKIRFYGSRLAPIDVFSNLNSEFIKHPEKPQPKHHSLKLKKIQEKTEEGRSKTEPRILSFLERRDIAIDQFFVCLKAHSKELFEICEALVISSSAFTSLVFIVSEKPEVQLPREAFIAVISEQLPNSDPHIIQDLFEVLDVERLGSVYIHQLVALMNFSRLHRGSSIDEIIRAIFEGIIWEIAALEQNRPPTTKGGKGMNQPITTYFGPQTMISFDIYKKHSKKKELMDLFLRTPLPFPSLVSALRTVCPRGGHRSRQRLGTSGDSLLNPLPLSLHANTDANDDPDSIDSFICHLYECALNTLQQKRHHSFRRQNSFNIFQSPIHQSAPEQKNEHPPSIFRQASHEYDDMVRSPQFLMTKVTLDDICAFASTQHEIQSRLRAELVAQSYRHDHNLVTRRNRHLHGTGI